MTDPTADVPMPKVTRARAVTVGAAAPGTPPHRVTRSSDAVPRAADAPTTIRQGGIDHAQATAIEVNQGGIGSAVATDIALSQGGIGLARGETVSVEMGAIGLVVADRARLSQGIAQGMIAREATFEQGILGTLVAERVTVRQPSFVGLLLASRVDGEVKVLLDWRGAVAAGAVIGLLVGLLRRR
jgi:hypothetical protein